MERRKVRRPGADLFVEDETELFRDALRAGQTQKVKEMLAEVAEPRKTEKTGKNWDATGEEIGNFMQMRLWMMCDLKLTSDFNGYEWITGCLDDTNGTFGTN